MSISCEDRCIGCLLGTACGEILGSAVEGWPAAEIQDQFGRLAEDDSDTFVIARVGNGIPAAEAVAAALWAAARYWRQPKECVIRAVNFDGDTDTIGAMAGALMGALHGTAWIPARWRDNIENGEQGRDVIVALGRRLSRLNVTDRGSE
jgi:ADP-ribosylglycohydrolase